LKSPRQERRSAARAFKILRMKLIATKTLTLVSGGKAAIAQSQSAGSSGDATIPQVPIGHRQPRADQVPSGKTSANPNDALDKENAILDQKMKSICRGGVDRALGPNRPNI
jgi:hypothetical protein